MGNASSAKPKPETDPVEEEAVEEEPESEPEREFEWPSNFYIESRDMMAVCFLVYSFAYILDTARKQGGLEGLQVDTAGTTVQKLQSKSKQLGRSFTPSEVLQLIQHNADVLAKTFPSEFKNPASVIKSIELLQRRIDESGSKLERPLTLEEFDDKHQKHELVYAITKDDINQRITLVFRGTENELAFGSNWSTNFSFAMHKVPLPKYFEGKSLVGDFDNIKKADSFVQIHGGFYRYLFEATFDDTDDPDIRKYDEIVEDVEQLLNAYPRYKLYITGHSLGGALATVVAFFMASNDRFPKPITCLTAAAPRVGDYKFLYAMQVLEQNQQLRCIRLVNDKDLVPLLPLSGYYHAGFQVRLYSNKDGEDDIPVEITYPILKDTWQNRFGRTWKNSLLTNFNIQYDHDEYRGRVDRNQTHLEQLDINELYQQEKLTGWKLLGAL